MHLVDFHLLWITIHLAAENNLYQICSDCRSLLPKNILLEFGFETHKLLIVEFPHRGSNQLLVKCRQLDNEPNVPSGNTNLIEIKPLLLHRIFHEPYQFWQGYPTPNTLVR